MFDTWWSWFIHSIERLSCNIWSCLWQNGDACPSRVENMAPSLSPRIGACNGVPRSSWNTKCVTIINKVGIYVTKDISHSFDSTLIIDTDRFLLGNDPVAIYIAKLLIKEEVLSIWMWLMQLWHIFKVYFNTTNFYDHDQMTIYQATLNTSK